MPGFKLPPLPKPKKNDNEEPELATSGASPDQWERTISIPVNDEILESLKVGDKVSVTLVGEVHGTNNSESKNEEYENIEKSIRVMISEVEVYPEDGEFEDEEGAMNEGYDEG